MEAIKIVITLNSPLLIAAPEYGDENTRSSLDFIPGSTIKGVVIKHYLQKKKLSQIPDDLMQDQSSEVRSFFFSDTVQFLNGYLHSDKIPGAPRALPRPASWFVEKVDKEYQNSNRDVHDFALGSSSLDQAKTEPRSYFWHAPEDLGENQWRYPLGSTEFITMVHNASTDPHKKSSVTSTVFRYQLLNAGQSFCAYIIAEDAKQIAELFEYVPDGKVFIGGSSGSSYGDTLFTKEKVSVWKEYTSPASEGDNELCFVLLSDLILKNDSGENSLDFSLELQKHLNLKNKPTPKKSFLLTGTVGGFNRKWGLPIIQHTVLQKGSCFVYQKDENLPYTPQQLEGLLSLGMGENRSDGFGRIGVNLNQFSMFSSFTLGERQPLPSLPPTPEGGVLLRRMQQKRFKNRADEAILEYMESIDVSSQPEKSQLNKLRTMLKRIHLPNDILTFLGEVEKKDSSFLQFDRRFLTIKNQRVSWLSWIKKITKGDVLSVLNLDRKDWEFCGLDEEPSDDTKNRVKLQLIDMVIQKALK